MGSNISARFNFAKWQQHITDWHRNLYVDIGPAPAINADELLAICAIGPEPLIEMGLTPLAMHAIALEKSPEHRWLAKLPRHKAQLAEDMSEEVCLYSPMTEQLISACPQ